ncbi:MAG: aminotransferase class V-fold PLP-dependent enzyme, partial [Acidobacteriota bacterium]
AGGEIVVTELDHHANIAPWQRLASERGLTIHVAQMIPETGQLDWDDLESKIGGRTKLVAIGAASNALGTINDLERAIGLAHSVGALTFVDAVHYAAHALIDVRKLDCDFLACSAYKFYGPHIGALYGKSALLEEMDIPKLRPSPDTAPERLETGTQNHEGIAGTAAAVDFLASLGGVAAEGTRRARLVRALGDLHTRGEELFAQLWLGLKSIPGVRVFGPPPGSPRTPTVSFVVDGVPSEAVATSLAERGIFVSHGNFYALTVAERLGCAEEGLVRAGCACYTTEDEVARLVAAIRSVSRQD